jgi:hypothetical protein
MAMLLCDNGGPAARKYGDLDGAVMDQRAKENVHLAGEWKLVTGQSWGLFYAPAFRMNKKSVILRWAHCYVADDALRTMY